jgi:selenocysteine lyase/cysteine desulfurase
MSVEPAYDVVPPAVPECDFASNLYGMPMVKTPFGSLPIVYADHTASGQPYRIIDDYLRCNVEPYYANTHSNAYCGRRMSHLIDLSRQQIRKSLRARETDAVIFTGSGSSAAVMHFIHILDILNSVPLQTTETAGSVKPAKSVVVTSDVEHNSNFLPWSSNPEQVELVIAPTGKNGLVDLVALEAILRNYQSYSGVRLGSMSAGSNITGVVQPVVQITDMLKRYGFHAAFDYAAVAPYVPIDMHPEGHSSIDAVYISPHKFLGGPGTPGLLVVSRSLIRNEQPFYPSGGTVRFASKDLQLWSQDVETRESGGTPLITGNIRCGLVFALKDRLQQYITSREHTIVQHVRSSLRRIQGVEMLVTTDVVQVPIFPLVFTGLHYNFVVALLSDLFGVQTRGGISCSGVGAERLLGMDQHAEKRVVSSIITGRGMPGNYGWCRVTFHYTMSSLTVAYILRAISFVSRYGLLFRRLYRYDAKHNNWSMRCGECEPAAKLDFEAAEPGCLRSLDAEMVHGIFQRAKYIAQRLGNGSPETVTGAHA